MEFHRWTFYLPLRVSNQLRLQLPKTHVSNIPRKQKKKITRGCERRPSSGPSVSSAEGAVNNSTTRSSGEEPGPRSYTWEVTRSHAGTEAAQAIEEQCGEERVPPLPPAGVIPFLGERRGRWGWNETYEMNLILLRCKAIRCIFI